MGMSTVPLSELYAGADEYLRSQGSSVYLNTSVESAEWDEEVLRSGRLRLARELWLQSF